MKKIGTIYITKTDCERLGHLIQLVRNDNGSGQNGYLNALEEGLEYAEIVEPAEVPSDVVTMRSKVKIEDVNSGEESVYSIMFPTEADLDEGKISILAPLATAMLGRQRGEIVEFHAPTRVRQVRIKEILYQPESAGDLDS